MPHRTREQVVRMGDDVKWLAVMMVGTAWAIAFMIWAVASNGGFR